MYKDSYYRIKSPNFDGEHVEWYPWNVTKSAFFHDVVLHIVFSDCTDEEITEIVFRGEVYRYDGWKPGVLFSFTGSEGGAFVGCYPEFDH